MAKNTIDDYTSLLEDIYALKEKSSGEESELLAEAELAIKKAKLINVEDKKATASKMLDNGLMDADEYQEFVEYVTEEETELELEVLPYMTEAALSMSTTLAKAEMKAYNSEKFEKAMKISNKARIDSSILSFIKSRFSKMESLYKMKNKPTVLKFGRFADSAEVAEKLNLSKYDDVKFVGFDKKTSYVVAYKRKGDIYPAIVESIDNRLSANKDIFDAYVYLLCGVMDAEVKTCLMSAKDRWATILKGSEKAVKEYVESVLDEYGDIKIIEERVEEAIENGYTSAFAARQFLDLVDVFEFANERKLSDSQF